MKISIQEYATTQRFQGEGAYRMLREAGFEALDWAIDLQWENGKWRNCWDRASIESGKSVVQHCIYDEDMETIYAHFKPSLDRMKQFGFSATQAHAPFHTLTSKNLSFVEYAAETYKKAIRLCGYAECPRVVIHGYSRCADDDGITDQDVLAANLKLYGALIPAALETGVTVLMENLFTRIDNRITAGHCADPSDAVFYIDTLNDMAGKEVFGLCFDVGHLNLVRREIPEYVKKLGKRIRALHLHDNDGTRDLHYAPFSGSVRWNDLCSSLKEIGYEGDLNFETFRHVAADRCEEEMVMPALRYMADTANHFRKKILG